MANLIDTYSGEQVLISSGRLVFNSRNDSVFLNAKQYINLSAAEKITIDIGESDSDNEENMFLINAPRTQIGLDKDGTPEPIVKGDALDNVLTDLMTALSTYSTMVQAAAIVPGPLMAMMLAPATAFLQGRFQAIKIDLENFKSTKSFTI